MEIFFERKERKNTLEQTQSVKLKTIVIERSK